MRKTAAERTGHHYTALAPQPAHRHWSRCLLRVGVARHKAAGMDWLPHVLYNAVILWEPFFVFSWLQLRFDRAFGIVPGVLLAGLSFAAYHIGTYPPAGLVTLLISGLLFAAIFRLTSNLLIVWPLLWCVGSSIGTLMGGTQFTWSQVVAWSIILLIQLGFIGYTWWRQK
jgi:hypothetical protein